MLIVSMLIAAVVLGLIFAVRKYGSFIISTILNGLIFIYYDRGLQESKKENYLKAIKYFEASKKHNEVSHRYIYKSIANCYQHLGINSKAIEYIKLSISEDPGDIESRLELSRLYDINGDIDKFEHEIDVILKEYPNHSKALYYKSQILMRKGCFQEAILNLEQIKKTYALEINISLDLCVCYLNLDEKQMALKYLNEAVKNGYQDKENFMNRFNEVDDIVTTSGKDRIRVLN